MPGTNIYFSNNGGFSFELLNSDRLVRDWGKQIESREWRWFDLLQCYSHGQWLCE